MTASFDIPFPYPNQLDQLDKALIIYRWIPPDLRYWNRETGEPTSNLWNPISDDTAHRLGFERGAVSIYFGHAIEPPETVDGIADRQVGADSGIAFLTLGQVAVVEGLGILFDAHTHPAHGILFRVGDQPKLSGGQRGRLNSIVKEHSQIHRYPQIAG